MFPVVYSRLHKLVEVVIHRFRSVAQLARVAVSKTAGWRFDSFLACHLVKCWLIRRLTGCQPTQGELMESMQAEINLPFTDRLKTFFGAKVWIWVLNNRMTYGLKPSFGLSALYIGTLSFKWNLTFLITGKLQDNVVTFVVDENLGKSCRTCTNNPTVGLCAEYDDCDTNYSLWASKI